MSSIIDGSDPEKMWHVECGVETSIENSLLAKCLSAAMAMNILVPLSGIEIAKNAPPPDSQYSFKLTDRNGRNWSQSLSIENITDPLMNWRHNSNWKLSEVSKIQSLRLALLQAVQGLGATLMRIGFNG